MTSICYAVALYILHKSGVKTDSLSDFVMFTAIFDVLLIFAIIDAIYRL